jgi:hypothetical protein
MSWALQKRFASGSIPSVVIGAGIAGSMSVQFLPNGGYNLSDCFADMGVDDNGHFIPLRAGLPMPTHLPSPADVSMHRENFRYCFRTHSGSPGCHREHGIRFTSTMTGSVKPEPEIETMEGPGWLHCAMSGRVDSVRVFPTGGTPQPEKLEHTPRPE